MNNNSGVLDVELIHVIVNFGLGSKVLKFAKKHGISGGTVMLAHGTVNNKILEFLGLSDVRKEIVYLLANKTKAYQVLEEMNSVFEFDKPNHGIAFTTTICDIAGSRCITCEAKNNESDVNSMYHIITTIVDKGKAEDVITAATHAGSKGGTIVNGRGAGIHETSKLFAMDIEPEKEIVIILSETDQTEDIVLAIKDELKIEEPGNGIVFVQNASKTYGIYK